MRKMKINGRFWSLLGGLAATTIFAGSLGCAGKGVGRYQMSHVDSNYQYLLDTSTGDLYLVYGDTIQGPLKLSDATPLYNSKPAEGAK